LFLAFLPASSAFATSTIRTVVSCELAKPIMDASLSVKINEYTGPGTIGRAPDYSATVQRFGWGRGGPIQSFYGLIQHRPTGVGGSTSYTGADFSLILYTDAAPLPGGKIRGEATYESNGQRFVEELACNLLFFAN
jgi:hypothetical protein